MPEGGALTIRTRAVEVGKESTVEGLVPGAYVAITFSDTGAGMSEHVRSHALEPFFTTRARHRRQRPRSGHRLRHRDGRRWSNQPRIGPERRHDRRPLSAGDGGAAWTRRWSSVNLNALPNEPRPTVVLVAEDEPTILALTTRLLSEQGYTVLAAPSGRRGSQARPAGEADRRAPDRRDHARDDGRRAGGDAGARATRPADRLHVRLQQPDHRAAACWTPTPCTCRSRSGRSSCSSSSSSPPPSRRASALRQRPKIRPPRVKPRPNVPSENAPTASRLAADRETLPAAQRLLLLGRSAALRVAACGVRHRPSIRGRGRRRSRETQVRPPCMHGLYSLRRLCRTRGSPPFRPAFRQKRQAGVDRGARQADRGSATRPRDRERRPDPPRPAQPAREGVSLPPRPRAAAAGDPREPRHPVHVPGAVHPAMAGVRAAVGDDRAGVPLGHARRRRPQLGPAVAAPVGTPARRAGAAGGGGLRRRSPEARSGSSRCHHHLLGAPWRSRKKPVAKRNRVLAGLVEAGADLVLAGHIHQSTVRNGASRALEPGRGARRGRLDRARASASRGRTGAARRAGSTSTRSPTRRCGSSRTSGARTVGAHGRADVPARPRGSCFRVA